MTFPFHTVRVDRQAEAGFRRRALRAMPKEYVETLWGFIDKQVANICCFMPIEHKATPVSLQYDDEDIQDQQDEARTLKLEVLGSIHTHPNRDENLFSECDLRELQKLPEPIMGICAIELVEGKRRKCHIAYWPGVTPFRVEYGKARG